MVVSTTWFSYLVLVLAEQARLDVLGIDILVHVSHPNNEHNFISMDD